MKADHVLKCWPDFFAPLARMDKTFDLRKNDRRFKVGDVLRICEYNDRIGEFTGKVIERRVTHVLDGVGPGAITPLLGLSRGYCILSLAPIPPEAS